MSSLDKLSRLFPIFFFIIFLGIRLSSSESANFIYNGFKSSELTLDGLAQITSNGLLELTNDTLQDKGHAFSPNPITFKPSYSSSSNSSVISFSTSFVFAIQSQLSYLSGHGIVFVIAPTRSLPGSLPSQYLGLFNGSNNGNSTNHVFGVELDTIQSTEFGDINNNHVGIDINSLHSAVAEPTSYFLNSSNYQNLTLYSGKPMRVWIEYNGTEKLTTVTIAPVEISKPRIPLLSLSLDLSQVMEETMYVGFSSATGSVMTRHYILGWSFSTNGSSQEIDISKLPKLPRTTPKRVSKMITIGVPIITLAIASAIVWGAIYTVHRSRKFAEEMEEWESDYGPQRFRYKDLYVATKGFKDRGLLGTGGFGRVYKGVLPKSNMEIAVKKVSHESRQGMREFVAEIVSIGRLRHRNLVQLLGYCRRKGELLLVYDCMPNGSLDKLLYPNNNDQSSNSQPNPKPSIFLNWKQRFKIIKGVASGLLYLHEEWEQVVVHRDIKASNVLLDAELNGRLGDFGLARLYDHGTDPQTTHVVGTLGYLAPEHTRSGKATKSTDVYAFGAFLLEVVCGRRPIDPKAESEENIILVDWVFMKWKIGELLLVVDPKLEGEFDKEEVEMVVKLGMMCSSMDPATRPTMREVVGYLEGVVRLPELEAVDVKMSTGGLVFGRWSAGGGVPVVEKGKEGFSDYAKSDQYPSSIEMTAFTHSSSSIAESLLHGGR